MEEWIYNLWYTRKMEYQFNNKGNGTDKHNNLDGSQVLWWVKNTSLKGEHIIWFYYILKSIKL